MTKPNSSEPMKDETTARFRAILTGDEEEEQQPRAEAPSRSLLDLLPRATKPAASAPASSPLAQIRRRPPEHRAPAAVPPVEAGAAQKSRKERYFSAYWTVTGTMSLIVNAVLIAVVIMLLVYVRRLNIRMNELFSLSAMPVDTVRGLYANFEKMADAHIIRQIPVSTPVPVKMEVCIRTGTAVVINQEVVIPDARVTVQTGGLNITNATTRIVLPPNTSLPVNLDLCVPVETTIPVTLDVGVDIPLAQTDLGDPFLGLQDTLEPLYCLLDPTAVDSDGILICEKAKTP